MKKTVVTITGIRPDFIRMSEIFKELDKSFNHILIHTGQHFDRNLSEVFFEELDIRNPDFNLNVGGSNKEHFHQTSELSVKIIELFREEKINPDIVLFLGDSNSVSCSVSLKKEGYKIGHIEAGMRSYDKRMLEEINRVVCDHCSDFLFVYHKNYKKKAIKENINKDSIFVVGNTIVEVVKKMNLDKSEDRNNILLDIHRPENFKYKERMINVFKYCKIISEKYNTKITMIGFPRTIKNLEIFSINPTDYNIEIIPLMSFKTYINYVNNCKFIISDSGTAQEEPSLLGVPVIVPRDFTERPESIDSNCSYMLNVNDLNESEIQNSLDWIHNILSKKYKIDTKWLGDGKTSKKIIKILKKIL